MVIRFCDIVFSFLGLILLSPLFLAIMLLIWLDSGWPPFYLQTRVGKDNRDFRLIKFRSMRAGADSKGGLTIGLRDSRITRTGHFLRRHKLDELPQLLNVLKGDMSLVGPRPEVRQFVDHYTPEQKRVLSVRPGITDHASLDYIDENELLGKAENPVQYYISDIMPAKITLNMLYIDHPTFANYCRILWKTLRKLF